MEPRHEQIARIALAAGARYGLALAGGYAVSAHGMGDRPSGDIDLFTGWQLAVDWRAHDHVRLAVGPVLHSDDAVANKICALFGRALPRDFLDVDAAVTSGTRASDCWNSPQRRTTALTGCCSPTRSVR
jgi:hypothetical protein